MNNSINTKTILVLKAAMLAAIYVAISLVASPLTYGPIQVRFAEALVPLAALSPFAAAGLVVGCFITNLFSPFGLVDIIFGTLGTVVSVSLGYLFRNIRVLKFPVVSAMWCVVANAAILGPVLCYMELGKIEPLLATIIGAQIAIGQIVACTLLGYPVFRAVDRMNVFNVDNRY